METRICKECKMYKDISKFQKANKSQKKRHVCSSCMYNRRKNNSPELLKSCSQRYCKKLKIKRNQPEFRYRFIYEDCKKFDNRFNLENDLTKDFIQKTIKDGCKYCGEKTIKMSLDRIDNSLGHLQNNVIAACTRCNSIRKDMPYEAWILLVPAIKTISNQGKFGKWIGGKFSKRGELGGIRTHNR